MERLRHVLLFSSSALLLVTIMFVGSLVLWIGVPLAWLWIGSQIQAETRSVGTAIIVMMIGLIVTIGMLVPLLSWLNHKHTELREARGIDTRGATALEQVLVVSAAIAVIGFGVWFFGFSGSSPIPLNISY